MASEKTKERRVVDALVDQELDTQEVIDKIAGRLDVTRERLKRSVRAITRDVLAGRLSRRDAKKRFARAFLLSALYEYCNDVVPLQKVVDKHLVSQVKAIADLDKPLSEVQAVRDEDLKVRALERAERQS